MQFNSHSTTLVSRPQRPLFLKNSNAKRINQSLRKQVVNEQLSTIANPILDSARTCAVIATSSVHRCGYNGYGDILQVMVWFRFLAEAL